MPPSPPRHAEAISRVTLIFAGVASCVLLLSMGVLWVLVHLLGRRENVELQFPLTFLVTTVLLFAGSAALRQARQAVQRERQPEFMKWIAAALVFAALFMGAQSYALWAMFAVQRSATEASLGARAYLIIVAALHVVHFLVASLFVSFVAARGWVGRYDHEYHWGVTVCEWFWHMLGVIWIAILGIYTIVLNTQ